MLKLEKAGKFRDSEELTPLPEKYSLLPFRFERLGDGKTVAVTEVGEYAIVDHDDITQLVEGRLKPSTEAYTKLRNIGALIDENSTVNTRLQILKLRSKYREMPWFTGLHMMVVTLRCNQSCPYCQVSRQSEDRAAFDMSQENADRALEHIFKSPNPAIKIEFQGGESLLNFELIKHIVKSAQEISST